MKTRTEYMNDPRRYDPSGNYDRAGAELAHREYYAQFVTPGLRDAVVRAIGVHDLLASKREAFNDTPIARWDAMYSWIIEGTREKRKLANEDNSLCTAVCIAKEAARQFVEEWRRTHE